jgi:hypothetical protein
LIDLTAAQQNGRIQTHVLRPLPISEWVHLGRASENSVDSQREGGEGVMADSSSTVDADVIGFGEIEEDDGIVLDAGREFRLKLYMGQV